MASNRFALVLQLLFLTPLLYAQQAGFFLDTDGTEPRFFQSLVWFGDEYVLHYEVIIQRGIRGEYTDFLREFSQEQYINVSLPSGRYRYRVIPHDFLGMQGESSEWKNFEVLAAFQPDVERISPPAFFMDQRLDRVLNLGGANFLDESEIFLRNMENSLFPYFVEILNRRRATLYFEDHTLIPGIYDIYIRNPGGPETVWEGFIVDYRKPLDIFLKTLWMPLFPVFGEIRDYFGGNPSIAGMGFCFEVISSKRSTFNGGLEIVTSLYFINPIFNFNTGYYDIYQNFLNIYQNFVNMCQSFLNIDQSFPNANITGASLLEFDFNFSLQKRFSHIFATTFRFGVGVTFLEGYGAYERSEMIIHFNGGLSFLFLLFDIFHIEAGADYAHHYDTNEPAGLFKPRLGFVWKF